MEPPELPGLLSFMEPFDILLGLLVGSGCCSIPRVKVTNVYKYVRALL